MQFTLFDLIPSERRVRMPSWVLDGARLYDAMPRLAPGETWRPDPLMRGVYASSCGEVMRLEGARWRVFRQLPASATGYLAFAGRNQAHKAIARAHLGMPAPGQQVRHLDGIRTENYVANPVTGRPSNLAYGTATENALDRHRHGTMRHAKLTAAAVAILLETMTMGETDAAAARRLGVSERTIANARSGRTWLHAAPHLPRRWAIHQVSQAIQ